MLFLFIENERSFPRRCNMPFRYHHENIVGGAVAVAAAAAAAADDDIVGSSAVATDVAVTVVDVDVDIDAYLADRDLDKTAPAVVYGVVLVGQRKMHWLSC
mmetsp:Transcript_2797/g.3066  ORF Transcript_2797/g.3066 Transcript_2797/m.3066 type:complete len:101 (-) Transcript_2797:452-754(-)